MNHETRENYFLIYILAIIVIAYLAVSIFPSLAGAEEMDVYFRDKPKRCKSAPCMKRRARTDSFFTGVFFQTRLKSKICASFGTLGIDTSYAWGDVAGLKYAKKIWSGIEYFEIGNKEEEDFSLEIHQLVIQDAIEIQTHHCEEVAEHPEQCIEEIFKPYILRKYYDLNTRGPRVGTFGEVQCYEF
jgi:hypothetical protein